MRKATIYLVFLLFFTSFLFSEEETTNSTKAVGLVVKANAGYSVFPGIFGYLIFGKVSDPLKYASGFSFNADVLYNVYPGINAGLNIAMMPMFRLNDTNLMLAADLVPVIAEAQFIDDLGIYFSLGLGTGFMHGWGKSEIEGSYFVDLTSGQVTGKSFDVWRGPYFILAYGLGWEIDLSGGPKKYGIDLFMRSYSIFGNQGLDQLGKLTEQYAHIPGFLSELVVNIGLGLFYRF